MCRETRQQTRNKQYNEAHLVASLNEQQQIEEDIRIYRYIHMYMYVYMQRISIGQRQDKGCAGSELWHER